MRLKCSVKELGDVMYKSFTQHMLPPVELNRSDCSYVVGEIMATFRDNSEIHPGHQLLRERIPNTHRRRTLVIDMCAFGVKDTMFRRNVAILFTDEEIEQIEAFINSI